MMKEAIQSAEPEFTKAEKVLAKSMMYLTYAGIGSFVVSVGLLAGLIQMKGKKHEKTKRLSNHHLRGESEARIMGISQVYGDGFVRPDEGLRQR